MVWMRFAQIGGSIGGTPQRFKLPWVCGWEEFGFDSSMKNKFGSLREKISS